MLLVLSGMPCNHGMQLMLRLTHTGRWMARGPTAPTWCNLLELFDAS